MRLSEDTKPKTAFATHSGLFQFDVMPFGLCNAPATFERLMSQVMRGLHWKRCLVYIDDILVFGNDFESALHSLEPLVRLLGKDCKFKWTDACQDAFKALRALLIKAPVLAFPKEDLPYIVDTDASDYGIGGVLSQCIEGTEHVIAYYSKSLNPAQQKYCTTRRELLAVVATLDHFKGYVWGPKFVVRTDHAVLVWLNNLKNIQGMLARWLAKLQQFHFEIIHRPGAQHGNADGLSRCPQCERGACAPNTNSNSTDPEQPYASSCIGSSLDSELIPLESGETCVAAVMIAQSENSKLITSAQMTDNEITIVRNWLIDGTFPARIQDFAPANYELKAYWIGRKSLFLDENNILWRNRSDAGSRAQLVVPRSLRDTIFNDSHHTMYGGHFGITHTHSKMQLHYFWPGMSDFVRDRISACHKCIARKSPVNRHHPMGHVPVSGRFERVAMDLLDVSVISAKGYKYILVVYDYFTKYTEAYPLKDKTAHSVADALMDIWLPRYGFPLFLHSDQGKEFDNAMIHKLSELLGTVKTKTTPYHPRSDGLVERFNMTLLAMLAMFVSQEHDNWDDLLPFMMLAYNTTVHTTTECNLPGIPGCPSSLANKEGLVKHLMSRPHGRGIDQKLGRKVAKQIANQNCFWPVTQVMADKLLIASKRLIRYIALYSMAGVAMETRQFRIHPNARDTPFMDACAAFLTPKMSLSQVMPSGCYLRRTAQPPRNQLAVADRPSASDYQEVEEHIDPEEMRVTVTTPVFQPYRGETGRAWMAKEYGVTMDTSSIMSSETERDDTDDEVLSFDLGPEPYDPSIQERLPSDEWLDDYQQGLQPGGSEPRPDPYDRYLAMPIQPSILFIGHDQK